MAIVTFNGGGSGHTANKGSSADLQMYLEHEMQLRVQDGRTQTDNARCQLFGADGIMSAEESTRLIDGHRKGLKKDEAKFYEFEINLSEGEQMAMFRKCATEAEKEQVFQDYVRNEVMAEYARNFKGYTDKSGNPIEFQKEDICWSAAIHTERYGDEANKWKKEHPNMERADWHAHITVAHRTMDQTRSISPKKNQRSSNKGSCQGYFDRNSFRQCIEQTIDRRFGYERPLSDTLHGRKEQRINQEKVKKASLNDLNCDQAKKQGHDAAMQRIAAVKMRKHMEAEALKARLDKEAAERRAAAAAKRQEEEKAKAEAKRKAASGRKTASGISGVIERFLARQEAERRATEKYGTDKLSVSAALKTERSQNAIRAIVANAKNPSKPFRYHISGFTAQSIYLALGLVEKEDTKELTNDLITAAKNNMGSSPTNWVELLRPDIEKVADVSIDVKEQVGTGDNYDNAIGEDGWKLGGSDLKL